MFWLHQNFVPWGLSVFAPGLYTCTCIKLSTKYVQLMVMGWPLTFLSKVKFVPSYICMGKILKNHFLRMY